MRVFFSIITCLLLSHLASAQSGNGYGKNIIGMTPVGQYYSKGADDTYFGIHYERLISEGLGIKIPVHFGMVRDLFQTGLSLKLYPGGHEGGFKYAVAPTLLYSKGMDNDFFGGLDDFDDIDDNEVDRYSVEHEQFGFMVINTLNGCINESFVIGGEIGLGINYLNKADDPRFDQKPNLSALISFNIGYRF